MIARLASEHITVSPVDPHYGSRWPEGIQPETVPAIHCPTSRRFAIRTYLFHWRVNTLLLANAILAGLIVGIGAYGQRYRHHPCTRFIFLAATILFLPINSYVVSTIGANPDLNSKGLLAVCDASVHANLIVMWAFLVQIAVINTSTIVSVVGREGRNIGPLFELLVKSVWTLYLSFSTGIAMEVDQQLFLLCISPFLLVCAKIVFKYYAFEKARRSFAHGHNPLLVFGYMQQLQLQQSNRQGESSLGGDASPPPLLVAGEEGSHVEKHPCGYVLKNKSGTTVINNTGLVTLDRVWQLHNMLPMTRTQQLRHLCFSFALFKLLRCRFARYKLKLSNASYIGTINFFWGLLQDHDEHSRVFDVIEDELSFIHDYYYSSLPISYSKRWLPILNICISILSLCYCIWSVVFIALGVSGGVLDTQFHCTTTCVGENLVTEKYYHEFGSLYFNVVPVLLLLLLVMVAEVRDIASYMCSNWTKVSLISDLITHASSGQSLCMRRKWLGLLLLCRCKLMKQSDGKMGQCSILAIDPLRTTLLGIVRRFLWIPDHKKKVKVPKSVKFSIIDVLNRSRNGRLSNGTASVLRLQAGEYLLWACNGKGTSDVILVWHIATCILELRYRAFPVIPNSDNKIVAGHLSRYCAYLVTWYPELLPDSAAWSKSLYEDVKKDIEHAAGRLSTRVDDQYLQLVELLSENSKHEVIKNSVKLGKLLVETINDEQTAWKLLADFWSEMILYVAPSDNLKGHSEAIARGGELITPAGVI